MPSIDVYNRYLSANQFGSTVGKYMKDHADFVMEETWDNDLESHTCYIYDFYHDDQPDLNVGMTYDTTIKTPIDLKFIITEYGSLSKDQPSARIMFKPSQKMRFEDGDELYYYETSYSQKIRGYDFPVGMYVDIPDEKGVYHKWLICLPDISGNQFNKYFVLPCTYNLMWVENKNGKRIKHKMWSVVRSQSSYNSGLWTDYNFTTRENQDKIWLPLNDISQTIWYKTADDAENQRLIVDIPNPHPNVWQVSKVEHMHPIGLHKITLYQHEFDPARDYIDLESGDMYADYWASGIEPTDIPQSSMELLPIMTLSASSFSIKLGGSYKTISLNIENDEDNAIKDQVTLSSWSAYVGDVDVTDTGLITWLEQPNNNTIKLKVANDRSYIGDILTIKCAVGEITSEIQLEMSAV